MARNGSVWPRAGWRIWWGAIKGVWGQMDAQNIGLISAGVAFYSMLALFPAVAAIVAIWGFVADPVEVGEQLEMARNIMPPEAFKLVDQQITSLITANSSTLGWATVLSLSAALWSARAGVAALIRGLNAVYRVRNRLGFRQIFAALGVTLLLIGVALVALACVVVLPIVLVILPLGPITTFLVASVRWIVALGVVMAALGVVYRYGPNRRRARPNWLTPGAIVAVALWGTVSYAFSLYLSNFGSYNEIYGALGAVVALLMWLYLSAFSVLLGASLNAELEIGMGEAPPRTAEATEDEDKGATGVLARSTGA
ncbi:YihY/virulence factor BrkB family protein [Palleronia sediminis]|uniref:YihY/virulence factor BrkB family protein n=1 Tax=Palleronia sediminis TaxID=2547833 RepID=A0A4V3B9I4_9RHOB|nr:YihY/virulence factor BrkB family protein [Palleronia sediminis]TDL79379.1 YihY/virulence factor BrkB family protein [Palleronia sediminis]